MNGLNCETRWDEDDLTGYSDQHAGRRTLKARDIEIAAKKCSRQAIG